MQKWHFTAVLRNRKVIWHSTASQQGLKFPWVPVTANQHSDNPAWATSREIWKWRVIVQNNQSWTGSIQNSQSLRVLSFSSTFLWLQYIKVQPQLGQHKTEDDGIHLRAATSDSRWCSHEWVRLSEYIIVQVEDKFYKPLLCRSGMRSIINEMFPSTSWHRCFSWWWWFLEILIG